MIAAANRIESLVTAIQSAFLDTRGLALTSSEVMRQFGIDKTTCETLLDVLVEAGVLANDRGVYVRRFPQRQAA